MADALTVRTARLLTDYLEYCARGPGAAARPPSTREAVVLRCLAAQAREYYRHVWSHYRGYQGNRVELVAWVAQELVHDRRVLTWGLVVALVSFTGTLLEGPPPSHRRRRKQWEAEVEWDRQRLVALLCDWLTVQHRAWLEARGGWDGFCHFFTPIVMSSWRRLVVQVLLSCFTTTILTYLWTKLP